MLETSCFYSWEDGGSGLIREDLKKRNYKPAQNLILNEKVKDLVTQGKTVYHLAFGQSPFPVVEAAQRALKEHVHEKAYEPVSGTLPSLLVDYCVLNLFCPTLLFILKGSYHSVKQSATTTKTWMVFCFPLKI